MILTALVVAHLSKPSLTVVPLQSKVLVHKQITSDLGRYKYQAKYNPDFKLKTARTTQNTSNTQNTANPQ